MFNHLTESLPITTLPLTAPIQPLKQDSEYFIIVVSQHLAVATDSVVVPVPS